MNYLQNHIWCSESNWDGKHYDCRHLVSLQSYGEGYAEDWKSLVDEMADEYIDESWYKVSKELLMEKGIPEEDIPIPTRKVCNLKPEVITWLESNIKDRVDDECVKGWAIGSVKYRSNDSSGLTVFFHRKSDAMKFIKTFSVHRKPINYCQYFTDVRKKLDLNTLKYIEE